MWSLQDFGIGCEQIHGLAPMASACRRFTASRNEASKAFDLTGRKLLRLVVPVVVDRTEPIKESMKRIIDAIKRLRMLANSIEIGLRSRSINYKVF